MSKNAVNVRVYNLHILLVQNLNFNRFEAYYKCRYAKVPRAYDDLKTALGLGGFKGDLGGSLGLVFKL